MVYKEIEVSHSHIGGSSAYRFIACTASVKFIVDNNLVSKPSDAAQEGSLAHEIAEWCLIHNVKVERSIQKNSFKNFDKFYNPEMATHVQNYINYIRAIISQTDEHHIEKNFDLKWIYSGMYGIADFIGISVFDTFTIVDLKYGKGVKVSPDSPQMKYYALGALGKNNIHNVSKIRMIIFQPRVDGGPVFEKTIHVDELYKWGEQVLKPAVVSAMEGPRRFKTGSHCRFCPGIGICPEMKKQALEQAKAMFNDEEIELPEYKAISRDQIPRLLDFLTLLTPWKEGLLKYAQDQLEQGKEIKGYKLVEKRTRRKWRDEQVALEDLLLAGAEEILVSETKLLSPAKLEKILKGSENKELRRIAKNHIVKPKGQLTIAVESDKRPAEKPLIPKV